MFVWVVINDKKTYVDEYDIDPCEECGNPVGVCREQDCVDGLYDAGCSVCGAESRNGCHCDNDYESRAGK